MSKGKIMWKWLRFSHKSHYEVINVEKVCVSILAKTFCNRPFSSNKRLFYFKTHQKMYLLLLMLSLLVLFLVSETLCYKHMTYIQGNRV